MKYDNISENEKDYVIEIFTSFIIKDMNESDYSNCNLTTEDEHYRINKEL